jgi:uncharacterized membrane protein YebE (DUF533 family)
MRQVSDTPIALPRPATDFAPIGQADADDLAQRLPQAMIAATKADGHVTAQIYAASLLVVDPEAPVEKAYLAMLAARLNLDVGLVAHLHANSASLA